MLSGAFGSPPSTSSTGSSSSSSSPSSSSTPHGSRGEGLARLVPFGTPTSASASAFGSPLSTPHASAPQAPLLPSTPHYQHQHQHQHQHHHHQGHDTSGARFQAQPPPPISTPSSEPSTSSNHHHNHNRSSSFEYYEKDLHDYNFDHDDGGSGGGSGSGGGCGGGSGGNGGGGGGGVIEQKSGTTRHPDPSPELLLHVDETPRARTNVRLRVVNNSSCNLPDRSSKGDEDGSGSGSTANRQVAMARLGFATVVWGCIMIIASLLLLVRTNTPIAAVGGVVGVRWGGPGASGDGRRHEIHVPAHRNMVAWDAYKDAASSDRVAVLYSVFGAWHDELTYEFERLVRHVADSDVLENHEVVLVWETQTHTDLPASTPMGDAGVQAILAAHPDTAKFVHITASDAEAVMPAAAFSKGFYYNPEVAAILYVSQRIAAASAKAGRTVNPYDYVWLLESDVRWTGDWESLFLQPYSAGHGDVDLFAFRTATPWVYKTPGWETSNCFVRLGDYPKGWRARGENATSLKVEWSKRIGCLMPSKRFSVGLLSNLNTTYLSGVGGYNEVAVPTVNDITGGSFGTSSETCMYYSYRNSEASILYDAFRNRDVDAEGSGDSTRVPCLLHPVKHQRAVKNYGKGAAMGAADEATGSTSNNNNKR